MKWFGNLGTQSKLMLSFCVVGLIAMGMGLLGTQAVLHLKENLRVVYEDYTVAAADIGDAAVDISKVAEEVDAASAASDPQAIRSSADRCRELQAGIDKSLAAYAATKLRVSRGGRDEAKDLAALRTACATYFQSTTTMYENLEHADRKNLAAAQQRSRAYASGTLAPRLDAVQGALAAQFLTIRDVAKDMNAEGIGTANMGVSTMAVGAILSLILGLLIGFGVARLIARPLSRAVVVLEGVAAGDFTQRLVADTKDEVGRMATALNAAVDGMRGALNRVRQSADTVTSASSELSSASQSISSGAQEQASALEETAASLEEMTVAVKQNADNAQQAAQLAQGAREVAEKGGRVVGEAVEAMREINASSRKIADIITAIDEIAFQTNLLALNAAVEAARAGEQGRGFAVVAGEVRNLAQRSASAAKEIKGLIHDSVEKVEQGSRLVDQSGVTLEEIVTSVKRVTDIVAEIAASSREQATGIDQVNTAVTQMDSVTQSNAGQTEELAGTADGLSAQAQDLTALVQQFKLGDAAASAPIAVAASGHVAKVLPLRQPGASATRSGRRAAGKPAGHAAAATGTDGFEEF